MAKSGLRDGERKVTFTDRLFAKMKQTHPKKTKKTPSCRQICFSGPPKNDVLAGGAL